MPRKSDTPPLANRQMKPEPEHNLQLVTVRTTRCDYCNQRNTDILLDCVECNFRICRRCIGQGILDNVAHHSGASARKDWDKLFDQKLNPTQATGAQPETMPQPKPGPLSVSGGPAPSPSYQFRQPLSNSPLGSQHSGRVSTSAYKTYTPGSGARYEGNHGSGGAPCPNPPQLGLPVIGVQNDPVPPFYQCVQGSDGRFYPISTAQPAYSGYYGGGQPGSPFEALQYSSSGPPYQVHNPYNLYGPGRPLPQSPRPNQHAGHSRQASASTTGHAAASPVTQGYLSPSEWHAVAPGLGQSTESFERTNFAIHSPTRTYSGPTQAPTGVENPVQYGGDGPQYGYAGDASPQPVEMAAQHAQTVASGRDNSQPLPDSPPQLQDSPRRMEDSMFVTQRSARPRRAMDATRNTSESSYRPSSRSSQSGPTHEPSPEKREDVTHDDEENGIQNLAAAASKADRVFNDQAHAERQAREDLDSNAPRIADMQKQELDKAREFAESMAREAQEQARQMVEKQSRESEERKTQEFKEQITRELEEKQAREIAQKMAQIEKEKQEAVDLAERRARFAEQRAREYAYGITAQVADWTKTGPQEVMRKALQEAQSGVHPPPALPDMPVHSESKACTANKDQGGAAPFSSRRRPNHEAAAASAAQRERARSPGAALAAVTQDRPSRQPGRPKLQASTPIIKVEDGAAHSPPRSRPNHEVAAAEASQKEHAQTPATRFAPVLRLSRPQPQATTPSKDPNRSFQEALARSNPGRSVAIADTHAERPGITGSQRFNTNTEPRLPVSQTHAPDDQSRSVTEATVRRPTTTQKPARRPLPTSRPASRAPTAAGAPTARAKGAIPSKKRPRPLSPAEDTPTGDTPAGDTPAGDNNPAEGSTTGGTTEGGTATGDHPIPGSKEVQEALSSNPAVARARHQDGEVAALDMVDTANSMLALSRDRSHVRHPDGKRGVDGRDRPEVRANEEEVRRQRGAIVVGRGDEGEKKPEKKRQKKDDDDGGGGGAGCGGEKAKRGGGGLHFFR